MQQMYLIGEIEANLARSVCIALGAATQDVMLIVDSEGGYTDATQAILLAMSMCKFKVHTYGIGDIFSSGVDILCRGATRGMHPSAIAMTHGARYGSNNAKYRDLHRARDKSICAHLPLVLENWDMLFGRKDKYWSADEMRELGFVTYVDEAPRF